MNKLNKFKEIDTNKKDNFIVNNSIDKMIYYKKSKEFINKQIYDLIIDKASNIYIKNILRDCFLNGKRLRPVLALEINKSLNQINKTSIDLSKIILIGEIVHNCSLIIDDLPCMDNDKYRRGNPTIHFKYGETQAQVITMYLLSLISSFLNDNLNSISKELKNYEERVIIIYNSIYENLGLFGAPQGQFLDISESMENCLNNSLKPSNKKDIIYDLIQKKTSTFFEISLVLSYIGSGGDIHNIEKIKKCANSFGLAFQISDDFEDQKKDGSKSFCPNYVNHFGQKESIKCFKKNITTSQNIFKELNINSKTIDEIFVLLTKKIDKYNI